MRKVGCIMGFLAVLVSFSFSQVMPDEAAQQAWQAFNQQHGGNAAIRWHMETGTPATIYGFKSKAYEVVLLRSKVAMERFKKKVTEGAG